LSRSWRDARELWRDELAASEKFRPAFSFSKTCDFAGIWINKWYDNATPSERMAAFGPLFDMAQARSA
jgi:hypothetical protein